MVSLKPFLEQTFHSKGVFHSKGQRLCLISSSPLHVRSCQGPYPRRQMGFISFRHCLLISPTPSLFTPLPQRLHSIKSIPKYHYLLSVRSFKSKGHKPNMLQWRKGRHLQKRYQLVQRMVWNLKNKAQKVERTQKRWVNQETQQRKSRVWNTTDLMASTIPLLQALRLLLPPLFIISPPSPGRTTQLPNQDCMPVSSCISSTLNMNPAFYQNVEIQEFTPERKSP